MRIYSKILPLVVLGLASLHGSLAHAGFVIVLDLNSDNTFETIVNDNALADAGTTGGFGDLNGGTGTIVVSESLGNVTVSVTTGVSKPVLGNAFTAKMDLNNISIASVGAANMTIWLVDTDFQIPPGANNSALLLSSVGGTIENGTFSSSQHVSLTNSGFDALGPVHFDTSGPSVAHGPFTDLISGDNIDLPFSDMVSLEFSPFTGTPFSIIEKVTLTFTEAGKASFNQNSVVMTPEPASLAAWSLLGLAGFGVRRIKRRQA